MKFNFFLKKQKPEYFLALDIGTETVKTLVFSTSARPKTGYGGSAEAFGEGEKRENSKIIILGSSLQYFDEFGVFNSRFFEEDLIKRAISKSVEEVQKKTKVKINNLFLSLPANVLRGNIVSQTFERKNPKEVIKKAEKDQIHQEVFAKVKFKLSQEFAQKTGLLPQDFHFLNFKILQIKIDGYEVSSIQRMTGQILEFEILTVLLPRYQLEKIKKICQNLNLKILKIVHLAENLFYLFPEKKSEAIFLDIGGRLTNIFWVEKGKLVGISEFGKGGIDFTQKLSQVLGLSFPEARSLKHDFSQSVLSEGTKKRIEQIFSDNLQNWFNALKENLIKEFPPKLLPSNIFLFGGGSLLPGISEILEKSNWTNLAFTLKPKIKFIYPKDFKNIEIKKDILNNPQDIPLFLISYG